LRLICMLEREAGGYCDHPRLEYRCIRLHTK
jgi:hypothetical protein